MDFLYATDLHGNHSKYKMLLAHCKAFGVSHIVLGGDLLPKNPFTIETQRHFIEEWLGPWLRKCTAADITVYWQFGNDDCACLLETMRQQNHAAEMSLYPQDFFEDYKIVGFPWVTDYPFSLKDWCLRDYEGWPIPWCPSPITTIDSGRFEPIYDTQSFLDQRHTIKSYLEGYAQAIKDWDKVIFVAHEPPFGGALDLMADGRHIGSKSMLTFLEEHDILLSLHGHIHESPQVSGSIYTRFGNTLSVQPGDTHAMHMTIEEGKPRIVGSIEFARKQQRKIPF